MIRILRHAVRSLIRDRFFTTLNVLGLSLSFVTAALIFIWAHNELHYDDWHSKRDRIYRVLSVWSFGGNLDTISTTPAPLAPRAIEQLPEIEECVQIYKMWNPVIKHGDNRWSVENAYLADPKFFEVFDFEFLRGNASNFRKPNDIILTSSQARRIYGTTDVLGQLLQLSEDAQVVNFNVCAVIEDPPSNSHLQFDLFISFEEYASKFLGDGATHWGAFNFSSYALLAPGIDAKSISTKLSEIPPREKDRDPSRFLLQPLEDIYLRSSHISSDGPKGNQQTIYIFSIIGLFIVVIASINYINLTTSRAANRARTTGIYKIVGASRASLFVKFLAEAFLIVLISSAVGTIIAGQSLPIFSTLSDKEFTSFDLYRPEVLFILLGTFVLILVLSGIQPALHISKFKPLDALNGSSVEMNQNKKLLRRLLVVAQFACSTILIIGTVVIFFQLNYVKNQKLGYEKEHVFSFYCNASDPYLLKEELRKESSIADITISNNNIVDINARYGGFEYEGKEEGFDPAIFNISVADNFDNFFGLNLLEGRWFREGVQDTNSYILNETAVEYLGISDPIGKWIKLGRTRGFIVGIVEDFHFKSLHNPIEQLIFMQRPKWESTVYLRSSPKNTDKAIAAAEKIFLRHEPQGIFDYTFLDQKYDQLYKTETRTSKLLLLFALLAIFISCLGIFGLTAYETRRRQKEIGIRKVLGSSISGIVMLISKDLVKVIAIALFIAIPISIYFMQDWLSQFSFHIAIKWWLPFGCCLATILVALLTSSIQSIRTAMINPIESIDRE